MKNTFKASMATVFLTLGLTTTANALTSNCLLATINLNFTPAHLAQWTSTEAMTYQFAVALSGFTTPSGSPLFGGNTFFTTTQPVGHYIINPSPGIWGISGNSTMYSMVGQVLITHPSPQSCSNSVSVGM